MCIYSTCVFYSISAPRKTIPNFSPRTPKSFSTKKNWFQMLVSRVQRFDPEKHGGRGNTVRNLNAKKFGPNVGSQKNWVSKNLVPKKIGPHKIGPENLVPKKFGPKKREDYQKLAPTPKNLVPKKGMYF